VVPFPLAQALTLAVNCQTAGQGFWVKSGRHAQTVRVSSPRSPSCNYRLANRVASPRLAGRVFTFTLLFSVHKSPRTRVVPK
jgi:hypothetical protein